MTAFTLKTGAIVVTMSAALLSHASAAEAQLGSLLKRAIPKPQPTVAQPPPEVAQAPQTGKAVRVQESTEAGPGLVRVRVTLTLQGGHDLKGNGGSIKETFNDSFWSEITLKTDGELTAVNPMDPESLKAADEAQRRLQEQGTGANGRSGTSGGPGGGVPGLGNMDMSKMMALQQKVKACGNDQACKQRIAMEMMNEQYADAGGSPQMQQVQTQIQAISNMCINEKRQPMGSKGYQDCMDAEGRKRTTRSDNFVSAEELMPDRYLGYATYEGCKLTGRTKITRTVQGVAIVEGPGIPYSYTEVGEGDVPASSPLCSAAPTLVYDTKTNTVWGNVPFFPPEADVKSTAGIFGRQSSVRNAMSDYNYVADVDGQHFGVYDWVHKALEGQVAASGKKTQVFEPKGYANMTTGSGKLTATMSWTIVRD